MPGAAADASSRGGRPARLPSLDGLRGGAMIAVAAYHARLSWMQGATVAISVFFPLSGYLITRLLLAEHAARHDIALGSFWVRRVGRLLPGAAVGIAVATIVGAARGIAPRPVEIAAALTGWKNWQFLVDGRIVDVLSVWWSLSIEEQFYLVYPFLVLAGLRAFGRRGLLAALLVATAASYAATLVAVGAGEHMFAYYSTASRLWEILLGCALAVGGTLPRWLRAPAWLLLATVVVLQTSLFPHGETADALHVLRTTITVLAVVGLIDLAARTGERHAVCRVMANRPLIFVAAVSYEAYVLHTSLLYAVPWFARGGLVNVAVFLAATFAAAWVLHEVTAPFRRHTPPRLLAPSAVSA